MCQRECRYREQQPPVEAHEEQQREHEQQMIEATEDMLDAKYGVCLRNLTHPPSIFGRSIELHFRLARSQREDAPLAIQPEHFHHGRGVTLADAVDPEQAAQALFTT